MAFAMLAGVVLLLGLGLAVAVKMVIDARRDLEHLEDEIADTRGLGLNLARDPLPETWSAGDFEVLREKVVYGDKTDDPYATLTPPESWQVVREEEVRREDIHVEKGPLLKSEEILLEDTAMANGDDRYATSPHENSLESWEIVRDDHDEEEAFEPYVNVPQGDSAESLQRSPHTNGSEAPPAVVESSADVQPLAWHVENDPPVVILVVGVGFLGAGGSAVTAASRMHMPRHEFDLSAQAGRDEYRSASVPPLSSFYDSTVGSDDIVETEHRDTPLDQWHERPTGNGQPSHNGLEPARIAWRPPA
jgi:hypothetical protein